MSLHLVTGHGGKSHVTAEDHGAFNTFLVGKNNVVLNTGSLFSASVITNNSIKVSDGEAVMQGRYIRHTAYEEVVIENGAQDYKRNDIICMRYTKDANSGVENVALVVVKGTPDVESATDPAHIEGDILNGALVADFPLYRVPIDGLNVGEPEALFDVMESLAESLAGILDGSTTVGNTKKFGGETVKVWEQKISDATSEAVEGILDGTEQVGDSAKLGGKDAEEYALKTDIEGFAPITIVDTKPTAGEDAPFAEGTVVYPRK